METDRLADIDRALAEIRGASGGGDTKSRRHTFRQVAARSARHVVVALVACALPFLLLVKVSVWLYTTYRAPTIVSLGVAAACLLVLLALYTAFVSYRITGRFKLSALTWRAMVVVVVVFCGYSILFISAGNVKSDQIHETYLDLHPLLRLAVSTLVLVDGDAVVTDTVRERDDYVQMGLPVNERSLHYTQASGYVHALDLRTIGRGEIRNTAVRWYFNLMGFTTIRHVGTADHLHVSLPIR